MHSLEIPAGSAIRLTATSAASAGAHRWDVRLVVAGDLAAAPSVRAVFGSAIGNLDRDQRIDIPAQDVACTLQVSAHHPVAGGWTADRCTVEDDTPSELRLGFSDAARPGARRDDVVLSFAFLAARGAA